MLITPLAIIGAVAVGGWAYQHIVVRKLSKRVEALENKK